MRGNLAIPPEFFQFHKLAGQNGMSKEHLSAIMRLTLAPIYPSSVTK